jgi:hypothetical protein
MVSDFLGNGFVLFIVAPTKNNIKGITPLGLL